MKSLILVYSFIIAILGSFGEGTYVRVCYYTNWSRYRQNMASFDIKDISPSMCSHLVWAFADIDAEGRITANEPGVETVAQGRYSQFNELKTANPGLKTLISVGGEKAKSERFQQVSATNATRWSFANSVVDFLVDNNFDGIDIDWEYPNANTKDDYILLLQTLRQALDNRRPNFLLFVAVAAGLWTIDPGYDVVGMARYVDLVNVMTYDYHVIGSTVAAFNAPLYSRPNFHYSLSVNWTLHYWHELGLPYSKMTVGVTPIGRRFILKDPTQAAPGDPVQDTSVEGPLYSIYGGLALPEICQLISASGAVPVFDDIQKVPYVVNGTTWVGYENPDSVRLKIAMMKQLGLAGMMLWSLDQDDFTGQACREGKYPLMAAILDEAGIEWTPANDSSSSSSGSDDVTKPATVTNNPTDNQDPNKPTDGQGPNSNPNGQNPNPPQNGDNQSPPSTGGGQNSNQNANGTPSNGQNQNSQNNIVSGNGSTCLSCDVLSFYLLSGFVMLLKTMNVL